MTEPGPTHGQRITSQAATKPSELVAQCTSMVVLMPLPSRASGQNAPVTVQPRTVITDDEVGDGGDYPHPPQRKPVGRSRPDR